MQAYLDEKNRVYACYFFDPIDRIYIEYIAKIYRGNIE